MVVVGDLLRHYPRRYAELGKLTDLSGLEVGQHVTIMARVASVKNYSFGPGGKRTRTEVVVTDGTGHLTLTFFQQAWRLKSMERRLAGPGGRCRQRVQPQAAADPPRLGAASTSRTTPPRPRA